MSDNKAYLLEREVHGHGGNSRLYRLCPPKRFGHDLREYVIVAVHPPWNHVEAKVFVLPATAQGTVAGNTVKDYAGTHTAEGNPFLDPAHMEGCFWLALKMAGYELQPDPPVSLVKS